MSNEQLADLTKSQRDASGSSGCEYPSSGRSAVRTLFRVLVFGQRRPAIIWCRFELGQMNNVEFLKQLLEIAMEPLQSEKEVSPEKDEDRGKAALTYLFNEVKTVETPVTLNA